MSASDTLSEATAPVKLPTRHCPPAGSRLQVRSPVLQGWYPNIDSDASGDTSSQSPSQAPLCHYTLTAVTNRREGTFRSLRYAFGGDHPSQTTHQSVSPYTRVRIQTNEGSYFNSGSKDTGVPPSKPPTYPTHHVPRFNDKL